MTPQLIITALIAAAGFGAGWQIQAWRQNEKEKDHAEQELANVRQSAASAIRRADNVIDAQNAANTRSVVLHRDLGAAVSELARLRAQLATPMPGTQTTTDACVERADTARELLAACATDLQELAGKADRHASDALMLQQAWPK